ncbi:hypothetical protein BpHYR1_031513 [Brachionus plicatilis]|uniref:Uncharacterized protein n=1 Tax=Brachionus plicatilis TaxID=10195 RepID=A0A3M7T1R8_BRAPC|nr:hypothetical protein BpHYR1_031513 [Brachionus plicatilis]
MNLKVYDYQNQTVILCTLDPVLNNYREIIHIILRTVLPFTIMLIANVTLIKAVRTSRLKEYYFASSLIIMNSYFLANLIPLELSKILAGIFSSQISIFSGVITIIYFVATYVSAFNHIWVSTIKICKIDFTGLLNPLKIHVLFIHQESLSGLFLTSTLD